MIVPVILSGGAGTRLWPLSRSALPKQFLALNSGRSLFEETLARFAGLNGHCSPVVVCNQQHRFLVAAQLQASGVDGASILLESEGRNTAPAVAAAALEALARAEGTEDPVLLVMPADHVIADLEGFHKAAQLAQKAAQRGHLVTFGIVPRRAETGYGYIRAGAQIDSLPGAYVVQRFVEKPDARTAQGYLDAGGYHWNSGMFLFRCSRYLQELRTHAPDMVTAVEAAHAQGRRERDFLWLEEQRFGASPSNSVDYAVMEHTADAAVVPMAVGWSDVGGWRALEELSEANSAGNVLHGDVHAVDVQRSYLRSEHRLVAAVGVDDLVVVETTDAVLVTRRDGLSGMPALVASLRQEGREELVHHRRHRRPWGSFEALAAGEDESGYKIKRICVDPGQSLSLQMHHQRQEHWVVVEGSAEVTVNEQVELLGPGQSAHIPQGARHRLHNPGQQVLVIIEVQCGPYLGEDDIGRFEDRYGRS